MSHEHDIRPLVRRLCKAPEAWQREDLLRFCLDEGIRVLNFRYSSFDGKLRELRLPVTDNASLERLLAAGERVDGSSLFPGLFGTKASDLYAVPVYRWAFRNPFADDELDIVCRFVGADGQPCPLTPDTVLAAAASDIQERFGLRLMALAEIEYYLILDRDGDRFTAKAQRNYHQSSPYLHGRAIVDDILRQAAAITGAVKYAHSEVGAIDRITSSEPELDGKRVEQHELELSLVPIEDLGCWLTVLRWLIRAVADRHGASATFVPKLDEGMAGTGLHLHLALEGSRGSVLRDGHGDLTEPAMAMIGAVLDRARSLTAFGNTVASSYLRLVPGQEAPTRTCWGPTDRTSLIRIPLDFRTADRPDLAVNPGEKGEWPSGIARPTVEFRSSDGSAFPLLLLAGITTSVAEGLGEPERFADRARELRNDGDPERMATLPGSAVAAAACLREEREFYEERGFPEALIEHVASNLEAEADEGLSERLQSLPAALRLEESRRIMHKDLHKH